MVMTLNTTKDHLLCSFVISSTLIKFLLFHFCWYCQRGNNSIIEVTEDGAAADAVHERLLCIHRWHLEAAAAALLTCCSCYTLYVGTVLVTRKQTCIHLAVTLPRQQTCWHDSSILCLLVIFFFFFYVVLQFHKCNSSINTLLDV